MFVKADTTTASPTLLPLSRALARIKHLHARAARAAAKAAPDAEPLIPTALYMLVVTGLIYAATH